MPTSNRRNVLRSTGAALAGVVAAPAVARAQTRRWRMVTSWPKRLPGPGMSAERVAERISALSGGRLQVTVHAAGELVPALEVLDAVGGSVAEMGHTAAFYWQGKQPAAAYYTTVPFGVKPFMGGNTGVCMGGWFRHEMKGLDDLKGLKIRSLGLGGEVYRRLGATPQTTPPGEILTSLQSGVLDAAEFVGPGTDIALGLYRVAPNYYGPGFNKPNGTGECIVNLKAWAALDAEMKAIIAHACVAEASFALSEMDRLNAEALAALTERYNAKLQTFSGDIVAAARKQAADIMGELSARSDIARRIGESYAGFRSRTAAWSRVSLKAVLEARDG
jgi:TRAP-type mannitol/chloroaromatic compound transport system substrate-binding protein